MANGGPAGWRFLFREEQGLIDAPTWRRGLVALAAPMVAMTLIWWWLLPFANRDLSERAFVDPMTIVVYAYLLVYAAAIMLAAVCFYFLSVKRWRDLARPPGLAGLPLLAALVDGAAHWVQPRVSEAMPYWTVVVLDVVLIAIVVWTARELGARPSRDD